MPIYTGTAADGLDMKEFEGVFIDPNNDDVWSLEPYPGQQKIINRNKILMDYMNGRYTLNDVYNQIKNKTCKLSYSLRKYVLSHYDDKGNFITN